MSNDDYMRKFMLRQFLFIGVGLAISFSVSIGMWYLMGDAAFPWNILIIVVLFMAMGYFVQKRQMKSAGIWKNDGPKKGSGWLSKKIVGRKYTCYNCGTDYKGDRCPNCGARGGRMQFG